MYIDIDPESYCSRCNFDISFPRGAVTLRPHRRTSLNPIRETTSTMCASGAGWCNTPGEAVNKFTEGLKKPKGSMYGIFTIIYLHLHT